MSPDDQGPRMAKTRGDQEPGLAAKVVSFSDPWSGSRSLSLTFPAPVTIVPAQPCWRTGALVHSSTGALIHWCTHLQSGRVAEWQGGTAECIHLHPPAEWQSGTAESTKVHQSASTCIRLHPPASTCIHLQSGRVALQSPPSSGEMPGTIVAASDRP